MLHFTFLGTSSGVPTLTRNVSGLAIRNSNNKDWILVDAGEGTQHRIQQAKLSLQSLIAICISHVHGDHCYGLIGLLASAGMNARTTPLTIIAPKEIQQWIEVTAQLTDLHLPYPLRFIDVNEATQIQQLTDNLSIQSHSLSHRVPSFAFSIISQHTQKRLDTQALIQLGVPKGKTWGDLQQGLDIQFNGQTLKAVDFTQLQIQRVHAIVGGDNDRPELLAQACEDAQLLIHESTYTQAILDKVGPSPMHSSAKMVAEFAQQQGLSNLILTHFSPRHQDSAGQQAIAEEVTKSYKGNFYLAHDFDQFTLDTTGKLSKVSAQ
ncbi:ribonuclease Z [Acinetobacter sp. NIPH 1958]|uniref:ribonuclease Z n=1 Tax=unclassified Acinetobacter TaxID=196816 RepID=UPI0003A62AB2|nr:MULTISPECIES: ribonuclease Z [unclassified Acinetobacter]MCH7351961.1 ribonuclease Z [Acinetobacter sp. NIPH 2023]MCH7354517.1 ribonuclease Z [Acinetobacter sp. NIPH 1958]MCH7359639.1 ribonuclease Z [Acinetobacter sp. NIPH 2024]